MHRAIARIVNHVDLNIESCGHFGSGLPFVVTGIRNIFGDDHPRSVLRLTIAQRHSTLFEITISSPPFDLKQVIVS